MNKSEARKVVEVYIHAWEQRDKETILECLIENAIIIEAHGLRHEKLSTIATWLDAWLATGSSLPYWKIKSFYYDSESEVVFFTWEFQSIYEGKKEVSRGSSLIQFEKNKIKEIRGFQEPVF